MVGVGGIVLRNGLVLLGKRKGSHGPYTSDVFPEEKKHYVTLFVVARSETGEPEIREPNRCEVWQWFRWSKPVRALALLQKFFGLFLDVGAHDISGKFRVKLHAPGPGPDAEGMIRVVLAFGQVDGPWRQL